MKKHQILWGTSFVVLSLIFGVIYKAGLISLDAMLYDSLTQQAVDKAWQTALAADKDGAVKAPFATKINVENQLASFMTVYDSNKQVVGSSGELDGQAPELPTEMLEDTDDFVRNYFVWEPKPGVRLAGVTVTIGDKGYVLAGRSMQESDRQRERLVKTVAFGYAASLIIMSVGLVIASKYVRK